MLGELFNQNNIETFNVLTAKKFGLEQSIYLGKLATLSAVVSPNDNLGEGFFLVDRKYIEDRTTIPKDRQYKYDNILLDMGIIQLYMDDEGNEYPDRIRFNADLFLSIVSDTDINSINKIKSVAIKDIELSKKKTSKKEAINKLFMCAAYEGNELINKSFSTWLSSVLGKFGVRGINETTVNNFKRDVVAYSTLSDGKIDYSIMQRLLEIASSFVYRDCSWAIQRYEDKYGAPNKYTQKVVEVEKINKSNGF